MQRLVPSLNLLFVCFADHEVCGKRDCESQDIDSSPYCPVQGGESDDSWSRATLTLLTTSQAFLTEHYLGIVMEFVGGGESDAIRVSLIPSHMLSVSQATCSSTWFARTG